MDVADLGRMAILSDPTGTVFGLWQAGTMIGAELVNEPGGLVWEDLRSSEPAKAQEFYRELFGFRIDPLAMAGPDYATFALAGEQAPLGGMGGMMDAPAGTPSHWLVYFAVTDTDTAVAAAEAAGGSVVVPAKDTEYGRLAGLADPSGAVFMVMGTTGEGTPDRAE
jgi:predicted enzyme related to lactoylglutathione lyase